VLCVLLDVLLDVLLCVELNVDLDVLLCVELDVLLDVKLCVELDVLRGALMTDGVDTEWRGRRFRGKCERMGAGAWGAA
jgi:hypothetical protein